MSWFWEYNVKVVMVHALLKIVESLIALFTLGYYGPDWSIRYRLWQMMNE